MDSTANSNFLTEVLASVLSLGSSRTRGTKISGATVVVMLTVSTLLLGLPAFPAERP